MNPPGYVIGLSGKAHSGKDTVASILTRIYQYKRTALADPLKTICKEVFAFTHEQLWGPSEKRNEPDHRYPRNKRLIQSLVDPRVMDGYIGEDWEPCDFLTPREALQKLGTEWGRECFQDIWIDLGMRRAKALLQADIVTGEAALGVAITDVRFANEIQGLKAAGAKMVRIRRPHDSATLSASAQAHPSEMEQESIPDSAFDYVLLNDESLSVLEDRVVEMMTFFRSQEAAK